MSFSTKIKAQFGSLSFHRYGSDYFTHAQCVEIINLCEKDMIRILGFDGFFLTPTTTQPSLEHSCDFSNLQGLCIQESRAFMARMPRNIFYEIVTED